MQINNYIISSETPLYKDIQMKVDKKNNENGLEHYWRSPWVFSRKI